MYMSNNYFENMRRLSEEEIKPIGDTRGCPFDAEQANEVIEETEEKTEDVKEINPGEYDSDNYSDEELDGMSNDQLLAVRFMTRYTPSLNVSDVVEITSGVVEVEKDDEESTDTGDMGYDNMDTEGDEYADEMLYRVGMEGWILDTVWAGIQGVSKVVGKILVHTVKYTRRVFIFSRNKLATVFFRLNSIARFWERKLRRGLNDIREDDLAKMEMDGFPIRDWYDATKLSCHCYDLVATGERWVFAPEDAPMTKYLANFNETLKRAGIDIDPVKNKIDLSDLLDRRSYDTMATHGYDKRQIPNIVRYFSDLSTRVPDEKKEPNKMEKSIAEITKRITAESSNISNAIDNGDLRRGTAKYEEALTNLRYYTTRLDFLISVMKVATMLMDIVTKDAVNMFSKFEDAMVGEDYR